jgi:hypothetical protein
MLYLLLIMLPIVIFIIYRFDIKYRIKHLTEKQYKGFILYKEKWYFEGFTGYHIRVKDKTGDIMRTPGCRIAGELCCDYQFFHTFEDAMKYLDEEGEKDGIFKNNERDFIY